MVGTRGIRGIEEGKISHWGGGSGGATQTVRPQYPWPRA